MRYKYTLEDIKKIAINKGGECLSQKYINNYTPLIWKCNKGHKWSAKLHKIKNLNGVGNKWFILKEANQITFMKNSKYLFEINNFFKRYKKKDFNFKYFCNQ